MAVKTIADIKSYFQTGDTPSETQWTNVFDTLVAMIEGVINALDTVTATTATTELDWAGIDTFRVILQADTEITAVNISEGRQYNILVKQDVTGNRYATFDPTSYEFEKGTSLINGESEAETIFYGVAVSDTKIRLFQSPQKAAAYMMSRAVQSPNIGGIQFQNGDYLYSAVPLPALGLGNFSVDFRYKRTGDNALTNVIFSSSVDPNNRFQIATQVSTGKFMLSMFNNTDNRLDYIFDYVVPDDDLIHFYAISATRNGNLLLLSDGEVVGVKDMTGSVTIDLQDTNLGAVGIGLSGSFGLIGNLYGEFRVHDIAVTQDQVRHLMWNDLDPDWTNAILRLDMSTGVATCPDLSGNDVDLYNVGGTPLPTKPVQVNRALTATVATTTINCGVPGRKVVSVQADTELSAAAVTEGEFYIITLLQANGGNWMVSFDPSTFEFEHGGPDINTESGEETNIYGVGMGSGKLRLFRDPSAASFYHGQRVRSALRIGGLISDYGTQPTFRTGINLGTGDFSIEFEFARTGSSGGAMDPQYLLQTHNDGNYRLRILILTDGTLSLQFRTTSYTLFTLSDYVFPIDPISRHHVITFERSGLATLYVNKVKVSTVDISSAAAIDIGSGNTNPGKIGNEDSSCLVGVLSTYRIFNFALTQADVSELYHYGMQSKWWHNSFTPYVSNFAAGTDGWIAAQGTVAGNIDGIFGEDDNLRFTINTVSSSSHGANRSSLTTRQKAFHMSIRYAVSSANSHIDGLRIVHGGETGFWVEHISVTPDVWHDHEIQWVHGIGGTNVIIYAMDGASSSILDATGNDVFYLREAVVTPLGAILDLDFSNMQESFIPDVSGNLNHAYPVTANGRPFTINTPPFHDRSSEAFAATMTVDLNSCRQVIWPAATQAFTLDITNIKQGREAIVHWTADTVDRAVTIDGSWKVLGSAITTLPANKVGVFVIQALGATDADIRIQQVIQP